MSNQQLKYIIAILGLQSISPDSEDNGSYPRRLDPTMQTINRQETVWSACSCCVECKYGIYAKHDDSIFKINVPHNSN